MSVPSRSHLGPICDTHLHIFGDRAKYPLVAGELRSDPPDAPLERFLKAAEAEGVTRMVFDQPSHYGLDNSCILDAIGTVGLSRARAIAAVDADRVTDAQLKQLDERGVRGIRINFGYRATDRAITEQALAKTQKLAPRAAALGWHLEFLVPNWSLQQLIPFLATLRCDFSVGHRVARELGARHGQPAQDPRRQSGETVRLLKRSACACLLAAQQPRSRDRLISDVVFRERRDRGLPAKADPVGGAVATGRRRRHRDAYPESRAVGSTRSEPHHRKPPGRKRDDRDSFCRQGAG
jgi:hypothetical protein